MSDFTAKLKSLYRAIFHREDVLTERAAICSGVSLQNNTVAFSGTDRIKHALANAVLMFGLVAGTTAAFAGAFDIEYNQPMLFSFYAIFSVLLSCMNCRKLWQNIGYILILFLFTFFLISNRQFINSGLNGVLNDFFKYASDSWNMDVTKTYNEAFEDQRYMTITMFFLTVGSVLMLLINFVFNNEQSPLTILMLIFPFLMFGLYFDETPGIFSFIMIAAALLTCFSFRHNQQFIMPMTKKTVFRRHLKHQHLYVHYSNGRVMAQMCGVLLGFVLAFSAFCSILYPASSYTAPASLTAMKDSTTSTVRQFLLYGLRSFFEDGDGSIGGLNEGSLGQAGTVTSDYQTDLIVTFAPYVYETIYLKSWVGTTYTGTSWVNAFSDVFSSDTEDTSSQSLANAEAEQLAALHETDPSILKGKMRVKPEDPIFSLDYVAAPYYTLFDDTDYSYLAYTSRRMPRYTGTSFEKEFEFYVCQDIWNSAYVDQPITTDYDRFVNENYVSVYGLVDNTTYLTLSSSEEYLLTDEDDVTGQLKALCEEQGFSGTTEEIISQIQTYLSENYTYSLNPGKLPTGKDFVTYFLFDNPYGYCSYFATAGTLLLRSMGIPARYAEGYVVSMSDVVESTILEDEDYDDWLEGDAAIGKTAVVQAEVDDSEAHAWCEVYLNGFGWVPVEFTPPSDDENDDDTDYWRLWNSFASGAENEDTNALAAIMGTNAAAILSLLARIAATILLALLLLFGIRFYKRYNAARKGQKNFHTGYSIPVMKQYSRLCRMVLRLSGADTSSLTASQLSESLSTLLSGTPELLESLPELLALYQDAAYGPEGLSQEDYQRWLALYRPLYAGLRRRGRLFSK